MKIEIRNFQNAVIVTFHTKTEMFDSDYERMKFFRGLYGWKQVVPKNNKKYQYHRNGVMDEVPHTKIANSVFIVAIENMKRITEYFRQWEDKIDFEMTEIFLRKKMFEQMMGDTD